MDHKKMIKFLEIIGIIFMSVSVLEIEFVIFLNFAEFNISGSPMLLSEFIYSSSFISLTGTVLWLIYIISIVIFLIVGFFIFKTANKNMIESKSLAKLMIVLGMAILIGALVKMNYLVLLGKTKLSSGISFQTILYSFNITPLMPAIVWTYFISVNCFLMMTPLIITAFGIKWTLVIEQSETEKEENNKK
ncbi:unnamed protein product [marine sediment metagenome]|uniref:Uncharacterized protein n=1 Tax=marine sediment metagenome TaxID=412755 RepID=X1V3U7_9ZZZZ